VSRSGSSPTTLALGSFTATLIGTWPRSWSTLRYDVTLTHHPSGFAVVFAEDVPDVQTQDPVDCTLTDLRLEVNVTYNMSFVVAWAALCPTYNTYVGIHGHT
jgi:hypothetical protein